MITKELTALEQVDIATLCKVILLCPVVIGTYA